MLKVELLKASPPVHCGVGCVAVRTPTQITPHVIEELKQKVAPKMQ
jgi:hypothetical protein